MSFCLCFPGDSFINLSRHRHCRLLRVTSGESPGSNVRTNCHIIFFLLLAARTYTVYIVLYSRKVKHFLGSIIFYHLLCVPLVKAQQTIKSNITILILFNISMVK